MNNTTFDYSTDYFNCLENEWSRISHHIITKLIDDFYVVKLNPPPDCILDFGCGNGLYGSYLGGFCNELYGVDVSESAIINSTKTKQYKEIKISHGTNIPYESEFFDVVFTTEVIEHIENTQVILDEIFRVLKPGGMLILTTTLYSHAIYTYIAQSKIAKHNFFQTGIQFFNYIAGYFSKRKQNKFISSWCYNPLGGHYHGFHKKQLRDTLGKRGFNIIYSTVFYAYPPIPLLQGGNIDYVRRKNSPKKFLLIPVAFLIKIVNYFLIKTHKFSNNVLIICKK